MKKNLIKLSFILVFVFSVFLITGCGSKTIVGTWNYYNNNKASTDAYYTFNSDKTGSYTFYKTKKDFTYEDDGKKVTIKYKNTTSPNVFEYKIEKDILTIKDSFGEDVTYKRK